jgi:UDP-N-acetyl-D-glucosamine dehydrogenase
MNDDALDLGFHVAAGHSRPVVCVQGLGFVGTAMALATATASRPDGSPAFDVIGVELDSPAGRERVEAVNAGRLPIRSTDPRMDEAMATATETRNLSATTDPDAFANAAVAVVDVGLDIDLRDGLPDVDFQFLRDAVRTLASRLAPGSLIVVETTVPPGTCEKVIAPEIESALSERGLPPDAVLLAHAYERVMPGPGYLDSIVNNYRVYAGHSAAAAQACDRFLSQVVNVGEFPLTRLGTTTASELAKLLENSYRATNIAFMEEWGRFAEAANVDLFEAIDAIRMRPTHSNIRQPGFGVGGYCLTKDPLFAEYGARALLGFDGLDFPYSERAVEINKVMPLVTLDRLDELLGGLRGKRLLLLGASYRQGVADTRESPSRLFAERAVERGAQVVVHDPLVRDWDGAGELVGDLPAPDGFDALVFAVAHDEYASLDFRGWLEGASPLIVDANRVLGREQLDDLAADGCDVWSIGRGRVSS